MKQRLQQQFPYQTGLGGIFGLGGGPKQWPPRIQQPPIQQPQDPWGVQGMGEQITGFQEHIR